MLCSSRPCHSGKTVNKAVDKSVPDQLSAATASTSLLIPPEKTKI
jgi:hypothetical protein